MSEKAPGMDGASVPLPCVEIITYLIILFLLPMSLILVSFIMTVLFLNDLGIFEDAWNVCGAVGGVSSHRYPSHVHFNDGLWCLCF